MAAFFDYLFYRVCEFYKKSEGDGYKLSAVIVVVAMQGFNVGSLFYLLQVIIRTKFNVTAFHAVVFIAFFFVFNLINYSNSKYNLECLREKWGHDDTNIRSNKTLLILTYMILSTVVFFGLVIYIGGKSW